ncbi:hypothetical protein B0J11DRAFT_552543 [Dendryphion nanum]|uniref:Zn(2)-C6 fungal-type domain-containing protein n=1 Tax=Dendryphion nanum TaxID=256645 RepID=A0A9P9IEI0_9PLEO|nr:hypothetical protein B0J11DRAFT_552543 [Dendryphion nanum]
MKEFDDELDLRYHRGLQVQADAYYRCPTSESLDGALRNEIQKSSLSIIPIEVVTEFVFASTSTVTIPISQQGNLDELGFVPADVPQSIIIEHALCQEIEGKARLKTQRAIARSFTDIIQSIDGFKYSERHALNKDGSDGTRFKYICIDSWQNRDRKANVKKEKGVQNEIVDPEQLAARRKRGELPTYDCGGAIHIKFSIKRAAVNIVYKHNSIHRDIENRPCNKNSGRPSPSTEGIGKSQSIDTEPSDGTKSRKRKRAKGNIVEDTNDYGHRSLDMSTSLEAVKTSPSKKTRERKSIIELPRTSRSAQTKKKATKSPNKSRSSKIIEIRVPSPSPPPAKPIKGKACIRCREKRIQCNEAKPTCNQCQRGLWTCQYEQEGPRKRSRNGCLNCRQRRRKCGEEKPSCAHCLKIDDECEYGANG